MAYQFFLNLPFGETMAEQYPSSYYKTPFKFSGKELDEETGLHYFGARYYDSRSSIWLSVDPLAQSFPNWNPYNYTMQNPIRFIDPDGNAPFDIIHLNKNGSINKVVKDGKAHITIVDPNSQGKQLSLSSYSIDRGIVNWNSRSRKVIANIASYYGKQVGVSDIGATYTKGGIAHYDPADNGIWISPQDDGRVAGLLNNKYNLQNVLKHEEIHRQDHANGVVTTHSTHASVYLRQMQDGTFANTTDDFSEGMMSNFIHYLQTAKNNKSGGYENLINEFNSSNIKGGYQIINRNSGGIQLFNAKGQEVIQPLRPNLTDPH